MSDYVGQRQSNGKIKVNYWIDGRSVSKKRYQSYYKAYISLSGSIFLGTVKMKEKYKDQKLRPCHLLKNRYLTGDLLCEGAHSRIYGLMIRHWIRRLYLKNLQGQIQIPNVRIQRDLLRKPEIFLENMNIGELRR